MNKDKRNNIKLLGTLNNADESGIIANANQIYDANEDKSTQDVSKEHTERIKTLEDKEDAMQTTLENITKTGEASAASNVTYNHNDSQLDATNVQQAIDELALGAVYDVSAKNPTGGSNNYGKWESLSALLSDANLNTLIPTAVRKGGMSIKFVQSSDNKYVQFRYMGTATTGTPNPFLDEANWQGVDDVPTAGSDNLVKSGGVFNNISNLNYLEGKTSYSVYSENDYINPGGQVISGGNGKMTNPIVLPPGATITAVCKGHSKNVAIISEVIEEGSLYKVLVISEDSSIHAYSYTNYDVNDKNISVSYVGSSDSLVLFLESAKERRGCFTKNFTSIETPTRYADGIVKAEAYATSEFLESIGTTSLKIFTGYYQPNGRFYIQLRKPGSQITYIDEAVVVGDTAPTGLFEMFAKDKNGRYVIHLIVDCNIISSLVDTGLLLHFADMSFFEKSESGAIQNIQNTKTIESALELSDFKQTLSPIIVDDIAYINPGGQVTSGGNGFYTKPIILPSKYTIVVKAKGFLRNVAIISEVITEGSQYNPLVRSIDTTIREYSYTNNTDSDIQIALSGLREAGISTYTVVNVKKLVEAAKDTSTIAFDRTLQYPLINPINETMDMLGIVKDWGFIGDSLNSGEIYYKRTSDNVTISGDMYAWSWGQNICQLCRTVGTNFSVGGLTPKSWIKRYWNTTINGYKTGGGGETFNANPKQVYTICLGTNDINAMLKGSMDAEARAAYIGSWDDVDINDFSNNADTFYGNYCGIIQRIKSIQPSAKIFLINLFSIFHNSDIRFEINAAISDINSRFTNTFLVDLETLVPVSETIIEKYGRGHFKVQGYMWFSYVIGNIINKIIRDNVSAFNSIPFIGVEGKDDGTL